MGRRSATPLFFAQLPGYYGFSQNARSARAPHSAARNRKQTRYLPETFPYVSSASCRRMKAMSPRRLLARNVAAAVTCGRSENPAAEDSGSYSAEPTKEKRKSQRLDGVSPYRRVLAKISLVERRSAEPRGRTTFPSTRSERNLLTGRGDFVAH